MFAAVWGSPLVVDGKVYLGDEDGDVVVLQAGKEKKVLAEMNMGSAVYATPVPAHGTLFLNNRNQLFALADAGEVDRTTEPHGVTSAQVAAGSRLALLSLALLLASAHPSARRRQRRPNWPQFRGNPRLTGVAAERAAGDADAELDLRGRRGDRIVARRSSTASSTSASANGDLLALDLDTGKLRWKYATGEPDRRIVAGGRRRRGLHRRPRRRSCTPSASRDGKRLWTFKTGGEIKSSPVDRRRSGADRLVRHAPLRARCGAPASCAGSCRPTARCTPRRRSTNGVGLHRRLRRAASAPSASPTARCCSRSRSAPTPARRRSIDGDRAYFGTFNNEVLARRSAREEDRRGATAIRIASFPFYSSAALGRAAASSSAAATRRSTRSTRRPARRPGRSSTRARVDSSPAVAGGRVYVGSSDGKLYVLDAATGAEAVGVRRRRRDHRRRRRSRPAAS